MKIYAVKEVDYERVKIKKAKSANRLAKRYRGYSSERLSIAEYTNSSLILNKLDEIEDSIERNTKCYKRLHDLDRTLLALFKGTICLNTTYAQGIEYAGCCDHLIACVECADKWHRNSSSYLHCRDDDGRNKRRRTSGFESLVELNKN